MLEALGPKRLEPSTDAGAADDRQTRELQGSQRFEATPGDARERAYAAADGITFEGRQMRRDIAAGMGG